MTNDIKKLQMLKMSVVHMYHATNKSQRDEVKYRKRLEHIDKEIKEIKALMLISGE